MSGSARHWVMSVLEEGLAARSIAECRALLGPVVPGATLPGGARVPGLSFELDPPQAAFNLAVMLTWPRDATADEPPREAAAAAVDADAGSAAERGALATLLAAADWRARRARLHARAVPTLGAVLDAVASMRKVIAMQAADPDAAAVQGAVLLLGGDASLAGRALRRLPPAAAADDTASTPLGHPARTAWRHGELAAQWLRAALYALRDEQPLEERWPAGAAAPWPGRLAEQGEALLRRCAGDTTLDAMPFDAWLSYLVDV